MKNIFETKAETLDNLVPLIKKAKILPRIRFTVHEWINNKKEVLKLIKKKGWLRKKLIIRSSALDEDLRKQSLAGHYKSIHNVSGLAAISDGITQVIDSFDNENILNQIFLQPYLANVKISGVAFSKDPNTGSPYIVINYDDQSGFTHSVTSGSFNCLKIFYCYKNYKLAVPKKIIPVINLIQELETVTKTESLDIEFAITNTGQIYLLQVRPLNFATNLNIDAAKLKSSLTEIEDKIKDFGRKHPYLCGSKAIFGIMPDWNPAEIIGIRPKPLALSLYKELVTDGIWAYQRHNYGYRNLRSFPLLADFYGLPYIDVRVDFNSFVPATIGSKLAEKLVNYYLRKLIRQPNLHDKVEFEIVFSCYTFDLEKRMRLLLNEGFTKNECGELENSLRFLTNQIINNETGLWKKDLEKIKELEKRRKIILESELDLVSKIYWLLEDCKRYGTLPFAGLARAGFIAVQLLRSMISEGILSHEDYDNFMLSINSLNTQMNNDFNNLSKSKFLKKYGHLRPGTYDILSKRYDENPSRYFDFSKKTKVKINQAKLTLSLDQLKKIEKFLAKHGIDHSILGLFDFIKEAIFGREYSKFIFTKSLSDILSLIRKLGQEYSVGEDIAFLDISCIKKLYGGSVNKKLVIGQSIEEGKRNFELTSHIVLPPLITSPSDVWAFHMPQNYPNFITNHKTEGHVAFPDGNLDKIKHSILLIPSADPGYDWIFSHDISGFITMYGGINSHMAIRAGELGLPAVTGTGEALFSKLSKAKILEIDCANKEIRIIR